MAWEIIKKFTLDGEKVKMWPGEPVITIMLPEED